MTSDMRETFVPGALPARRLYIARIYSLKYSPPLEIEMTKPTVRRAVPASARVCAGPPRDGLSPAARAARRPYNRELLISSREFRLECTIWTRARARLNLNVDVNIHIRVAREFAEIVPLCE